MRPLTIRPTREPAKMPTMRATIPITATSPLKGRQLLELVSRVLELPAHLVHGLPELLPLLIESADEPQHVVRGIGRAEVVHGLPDDGQDGERCWIT